MAKRLAREMAETQEAIVTVKVQKKEILLSKSYSSLENPRDSVGGEC